RAGVRYSRRDERRRRLRRVGAHARTNCGRTVTPLTMSSNARLRRLILIGAGRANLQLLRGLSRSLVRGLEVVVVPPEMEMFDPSMPWGLLRGAYEPGDARIDVAALATRAGARVVQASA